MTARRGSAAQRHSSGFKVPAGAPAFCATLDGMDEAEARGLIEPGKWYGIGPKKVMGAGRATVVVVMCDGPDRPFRVLDGADVVRGVTASWSAAARIIVALAVEHEARTGRVAEPKP